MTAGAPVDGQCARAHCGHRTGRDGTGYKQHSTAQRGRERGRAVERERERAGERAGARARDGTGRDRTGAWAGAGA